MNISPPLSIVFCIFTSLFSLQAQSVEHLVEATQSNLTKNKERFEKVKLLYARKAQYLSELKNGKIVSFPEVQKNWKDYTKKTTDLSALWNDSFNEKDLQKRDKLHKAVFAALQPLGWLLKSAKHPKTNRTKSSSLHLCKRSSDALSQLMKQPN